METLKKKTLINLRSIDARKRAVFFKTVLSLRKSRLCSTEGGTDSGVIEGRFYRLVSGGFFRGEAITAVKMFSDGFINVLFIFTSSREAAVIFGNLWVKITCLHCNVCV